MRFKLIITMVDASHSDAVLAASRSAGATGATIINFARGEDDSGPLSRLLGWDLSATRQVLLLLARDDLARTIMEHINRAGELDASKNTGLVVQLDVEDAVGVRSQWLKLAGMTPPT